MRRYEYHTQTSVSHYDLDDLGKQGWLVTTGVYDDGGLVYKIATFVRPIEDDADPVAMPTPVRP